MMLFLGGVGRSCRKLGEDEQQVHHTVCTGTVQVQLLYIATGYILQHNVSYVTCHPYYRTSLLHNEFIMLNCP